MQADEKKIVEAIKSFGRFSESDILIMLEQFSIKEWPKNSFLLQAGDTCNSLNYLLKGCMRAYRVDSDNTEHVEQLYLEGDWVLNRESFTAQQPSRLSIQAYEDCRVAEIQLCDLHDLIGRSPAFFSLGRIIYSEDKFPGHSRNASPEEKYRQLLTQRPGLLQRFTLKSIASMLGMTPETLSRVRRKVR